MRAEILGIILIALIVGVVGGRLVWSHINQNGFSITTSQSISGRVTAISNDCQADGVCSVTLDNTKKIVTGCGMMAGGKTCKMFDQSHLYINEPVNATVVQTGPGAYDLSCKDCTIRPASY